MGWWEDLLSNPTLSRSKMTAKDNGKRKGDWLQPAAEWVSDAIPNEFSKLNNQWTGNIPYVGWFLKGMAAADNFSETYANTGDITASAKHGAKGMQGVASDPYAYSPKNQPGLSPDWSKDWAGNVGKILNVGGSARSGNYGDALSGVVGMFSKYDENNKGYYPMTGVGVGSAQDPNVRRGGSSSEFGGMDLGGIMSMFGSGGGGGIGSVSGGQKKAPNQDFESMMRLLTLMNMFSSDDDFLVGGQSNKMANDNPGRITFAPSYAM